MGAQEELLSLSDRGSSISRGLSDEFELDHPEARINLAGFAFRELKPERVHLIVVDIAAALGNLQVIGNVERTAGLQPGRAQGRGALDARLQGETSWLLLVFQVGKDGKWPGGRKSSALGRDWMSGELGYNGGSSQPG